MADESIDPLFAAEVETLASILDQLDYYRILRVDPGASLGLIQTAYHQRSRLFHPDRYFHLPDSPFKEAVYRISKRVTEAYVTLRDPQQRQYYDRQLAESDGRAVRFTESSAQQQKQAKVEETGRTEQGRRLHRQGMQEMKRGNFTAAERAFKTAMAYEPDNPLFKQLAEEAARNIKTDYSIH